MRIVIIGISGTIGTAVNSLLEATHEVIGVSHTRAETKLDMTRLASIKKTLEAIGTFDALVVAAGAIAFNNFVDMTEEEWAVGINNKLMGQVNLTQIALNYLSPKGSITLTTGVLSRESVAQGTSASMINGALEHFVKSVATELPNGIRINAVNPSILEESVEKYGAFFPGFKPVPSRTVALAYQKSIEGVETGRTIEVFN